MTTVLPRPLSRNLLAAGFAVLGTFAGFTATTAPADAGGVYRATLVTPIAESRQEILGSALWRCEGTSCRTGSDDSSPNSSCARVARTFGSVASFSSTRGEFTAEQLERCNARA